MHNVLLNLTKAIIFCIVHVYKNRPFLLRTLDQKYWEGALVLENRCRSQKKVKLSDRVYQTIFF
jgi:hypothetical protein